MGRAARPLHDPGNHRSIERGSNLQAARRGGLMKPAKLAGARVNTAALTPSLGTRSTDVRARDSDDGRATRYFQGYNCGCVIAGLEQEIPTRLPDGAAQTENTGLVGPY